MGEANNIHTITTSLKANARYIKAALGLLCKPSTMKANIVLFHIKFFGSEVVLCYSLSMVMNCEV